LADAQSMLQGRESGAWPDVQVYTGMLMAAQSAPSSFATDALVKYLAGKQRAAGNWRGRGATRAPMQDGDFSRAAMSIRTLAAYGTPVRKERICRTDRARGELARQSHLAALRPRHAAFGIKCANGHTRVRQVMTHALMESQRRDGGWAKTPYLPSDAYATGQVRYALPVVGVPANDPTLQCGTSLTAEEPWPRLAPARRMTRRIVQAVPRGRADPESEGFKRS
jgi:hypothetical protein